MTIKYYISYIFDQSDFKPIREFIETPMITFIWKIEIECFYQIRLRSYRKLGIRDNKIYRNVLDVFEKCVLLMTFLA